MAKKRNRSCFSVKNELLLKSQEAALSAVEIFNNPNTQFKSESFIVLMIISWTYLLHAYYREQGVDYCYFKQNGKRKKYDKTKNGAIKHWELGRCLNDAKCPISKDIKNNLFFLIGLRHEIEHQMTSSIDDIISAKFQACCINYNNIIKEWFGKKFALDNKLSLAIQFLNLSDQQIKQLKNIKGVPNNIIDFITNFEHGLSEEEKISPSFSYKVIYIPISVNHEGQADIAYRFLDEKSAEGKEIHNVIVKSSESEKFRPSDIVAQMKTKGFEAFNMHKHTELWKRLDAKNKKYKYGCNVAGTWYWYKTWANKVAEELKKAQNNE